MKLFPLLIGSVVVGSSLGAALAYVSVGTVAPPIDPAEFLADAGPVEPPVSEQSGPQARARVDEPEYKFDKMQRGTSRSHTFLVHNDGDLPLQLETGETSCKCTEFAAAANVVPPGESAEVKLEWAAKVLAGPFRQTALLRTPNDPRQSEIVLSVVGEVIEAVGLTPQQFDLGRVSTDAPSEASVVLMAFDQAELEVSAEAPTRDGKTLPYRVQVEPLIRKDFPDPKAEAAVRITLVAEPGMPVGVLHDWVRLQTNLPSAESQQVPVYGRVEGDLSVRGYGWSADNGVLTLGMVDSDIGRKANLRISMKGSTVGANLSITEVEPPELRATLGQGQVIREGVVHVPLAVEVPAGTRPMVRLQTGRKPDGTYQHPEGLIRLECDSPGAPQLELRVRFAVQGSGR